MQFITVIRIIAPLAQPFQAFRRSRESPNVQMIPQFFALVPKLPFGNAPPGNSVSMALCRIGIETEFRERSFPNGSLGTRKTGPEVPIAFYPVLTGLTWQDKTRKIHA